MKNEILLSVTILSLVIISGCIGSDDISTVVSRGNTTIINNITNVINGSSGTLIYFFNSQISQNTVNTSFRMLPSPNSTEHITTYSGLTTGVSIQNWTTVQGTPSLTSILAGEFLVHIHASSSNNNMVQLHADIWEVNNTGVFLQKIGSTESELLTTTEEQYNMAFQAANVTFLQSNRSRIMVQIIPNVLLDNPSITLYYGGEADSHISLPSQTVDATNFVPYTGATGDVNLDGHNISASNLNSSISSLQNNDTKQMNLIYSFNYTNMANSDRIFNTTYWNNNSFPITVSINIGSSACTSQATYAIFRLNDTLIYYGGFARCNSGDNLLIPIYHIIPQNTSYRLDSQVGTSATFIYNWYEGKFSIN